jgi:RNA polymerase sigma-70 factor (family 1)
MTNCLPHDIKFLVELMAKDDEAAFRYIYNIYHQKIYSFSYFLTRSTTLAEDITQEIFVKIWVNREKLSAINNFENWLAAVIKNHTYNCLSRSAKERLVLDSLKKPDEKIAPAAENNMISKEFDLLLRNAINRLPPQQKKVYLLRRQDGLELKEIAALLGLSINTIKNHLKAALSGIRTVCEQNIGLIISAVLLSEIFFPELAP